MKIKEEQNENQRGTKSNKMKIKEKQNQTK